LLFLLRCVVPIPSASNGLFALYRSSGGQLSIEPQLRSLAGRDSLRLIFNEISRWRSSRQQALKSALPNYPVSPHSANIRSQWASASEQSCDSVVRSVEFSIIRERSAEY